MQQVNGIKIYNLTSGKTQTQFYDQAQKLGKSLRYNQQFRNRFQLIQDFQFPTHCNQVTITQDQKHIIAAGAYGPQLKIFDLKQLSLKCMRGLDSQVVKFAIIQQDYRKIAMACFDRNIQFHTQFGRHYKTRVPKCPRDINYSTTHACLSIAASDSQIYRICLQQGKFLSTFNTSSPGVNTLCYNPKLDTLLAGTQSGFQVWDCRDRQSVVNVACGNITAIQNDIGGLLFATGNKQGLVQMWDVRRNTPIFQIQHHYRKPINSIKFHQKSRQILTSTKIAIKISSKDNGKLFTTIQPHHGINMFQLVKQSGLILCALQTQRIGAFFLPGLDKAPSWIPHLQGMTQQLQQQRSSLIYDQYKFLLLQQIQQMRCQQLIGTKMLKPHLHGYLMHLKLYRKLQHKSKRIAFNQYKKQLLSVMLDQQQPTKIQNKPQLNIEDMDPRFKKMFVDKRFKVDKLSQQYMLRHPNQKKQIQKQRQKQQVQLRKMAGKRRKSQRMQIQ